MLGVLGVQLPDSWWGSRHISLCSVLIYHLMDGEWWDLEGRA